MSNLTGGELFQQLGILSNGLITAGAQLIEGSQISALQFFGVTVISTGASYTMLSTDVLIAFNSPNAALKTLALLAPTDLGKSVVIKDAIGTAGTYGITITPASGTIDGAASYTLRSNYKSVTLVADGVSNWMVV